jgi:hypothetical protein
MGFKEYEQTCILKTKYCFKSQFRILLYAFTLIYLRQEMLGLLCKLNFYCCVRKSPPRNLIMNHVHVTCSANLTLFYLVTLMILVKVPTTYGPPHTWDLKGCILVDN